ncbi:MAG: flagellar biosynthesis anti-sigma factor FlgM [Spirochaetes bacterium]|nr:flagellar biosynthesis anti-sigma factor FlgM [Spirochaetota bacterium]
MDIKGIDGINHIIQNQKTKKVDKPKDTKRKDEVALSNEAKRAAEFEKYKDIVKKVSGIREDKVRSAKERLQSGKLFSKEVLEAIADRLADKLLIGDKILDNLGDDKDE